MKISYNWLKWYIPEVPSHEKLKDVFTFHLCEVESLDKLGTGDQEDWIFDINILPNRAHDLLSHQGVARELSGLLGIPFNDPTPKYKVPQFQPTNLKIDLQSDKCRRYMGRIVRNVKVGPSPEWVVKHLESVGQRSINNIVDATNIVMLDCGNPTHAFDLGKMASENIIVRNAVKGEKMTTLGRDKIEVELGENNLVIADENNVLALAGVKGGKKAEVDENTTSLVLEVANFDPVSVRKTARSKSILTDSSKRFENDLSPEQASYAMTELSSLIFEMCPNAEFEEIVDIYPMPQEKRTLIFSSKKIGNILGLEVSGDEIENILKCYNFEYTKVGKRSDLKNLERSDLEETFEINIPALRLDLIGLHDMAEEIGRDMGYDKVAPKIPQIDFKPKVNESVFKILAAREKLLADGYSETITYSFGEKGTVRVMQSAENKNFLRENLKDGLGDALKRNTLNAPLLGIDQVKLFEIGTVFTKNGEELRVAYNDKKNIVEMSLDEFCEKNNIAVSDTYGDLLGSDGGVVSPFVPWSQYPFITRDIAVWVPESVTSDVLKELYIQKGTELLLGEPRLVDTFSKDGKTSYAFRLVFQSFERTLTDTEISTIMDGIYAKIKQESGWEVR